MADVDQITTNRPPDDAFRQQKLQAWQPIMTPLKVVLVFLAVGIAFIPAGVSLNNSSNKIYEQVIEYDGSDMDYDCSVKTVNQNRACKITFNITEDVDGPLHVYYQLTNYYQNHRRYVASRSPTQLNGDLSLSKSDLSTECQSMYENGTKLVNPCGLIANSYFTDIISLDNYSSIPSNLAMDETGISWDSDAQKFSQPDGFKSEYVDSNQVACGTVSCTNNPSCDFHADPDSSSGAGWNYCYPDPDSYQYLYQSYPAQISPVEGVLNEHFMVWMRTAALPKFRKIYGKIDGNFKKGDVIVFDLTANFEVNSFDGTKALVLGTVGEFGGKNPYLGQSYIIVGSISLLFAVLFVMKQLVAPRPVADAALLNWSVST